MCTAENILKTIACPDTFCIFVWSQRCVLFVTKNKTYYEPKAKQPDRTGMFETEQE